MKQILKQYFQFSKKEFLIFTIIFTIILGFIIYPTIDKNKSDVPRPINNLKPPTASVQKNEANKTEQNSSSKNDYQFITQSTNDANNTLNPFKFNPNTLDELGFKKLGLRDKTIKTIINYRNKGGKFFIPDDFKKIWGLKKEEAEVLIPFIVIENTFTNFKSLNAKNLGNTTPPLKSICINTANAYELKAVPAIGNFAYKIVNFREKLGGFISIKQVAETYGITDSMFNASLPYLTITNTTIQKININIASEWELSEHPYITKDVARAITIYRTQHGLYKSIEDIKK